MNLDQTKIHQSDGNNVYGIIYTSNIDENLLKLIGQAFNITEQEIRFKISHFDNAKSLIYCHDNFEFIVYEDGVESLFNGRIAGTEPLVHNLLNQLFIVLTQRNIQSCFEFYDENHDLVFEIL